MSDTPDWKQLDFSWRWYATTLWRGGLISVQLVAATLLIELFGLTLPFFYIVIFDRVFGRSNLATLDVIAIGVLAVLLFDLVVKVLRAWLMNFQVARLNAHSARLILNAAMTDDTRAVQQERIAPAVWVEALLGQLQKNQSTLMLIFSGLFDAGFALVILVVLLLMHPVMALVALAPVVPVMLYQVWHAPREKQRARQAAQQMERYKARLLEILTQRDTITMVAGATRQRDALNRQLNDIQNENRHARLDQMGQGNIPGFFINLGSMVTLYVGAHLVLAGQLSFGVYLAINMISRNVLGSVQKALSAWLQYQELSDTLAGKIAPVLMARPPQRILLRATAAPAEVILESPAGGLSVTDLRYAYARVSANASDPAGGDETAAVQGISFTLQPGERIVLAGRSGSGKSTLCHLLARLLTPSHGLITLDGSPIGAIADESFRRAVTYLPQNPGLLSGTLEENIALARPEANLKDILEAARLAGLQSMLQASAQGIQSVVSPMGMNLSEGVKKQVLLARLFLMQPAVVILDSVFNRFPADLRIEVLNNLQTHCPKATLIFVTQYLPLHQQADRILVMDGGKLVEAGGFESLLAARGTYYHLYATPQPGGNA
ncbi:MAG: peptidase domain-containing ABC transporter [Candidatus Melainabacteria bacterium]